jgi:hypothetical protein
VRSTSLYHTALHGNMNVTNVQMRWLLAHKAALSRCWVQQHNKKALHSCV